MCSLKKNFPPPLKYVIVLYLHIHDKNTYTFCIKTKSKKINNKRKLTTKSKKNQNYLDSFCRLKPFLDGLWRSVEAIILINTQEVINRMVHSAVGAEFGVKLGALTNNYIFTYKIQLKEYFMQERLKRLKRKKT